MRYEERESTCAMYVDELAQYIERKKYQLARKSGLKHVEKGRRFNSEQFLEFRVEN
jgi:predicted transcriptional regulator